MPLLPSFAEVVLLSDALSEVKAFHVVLLFKVKSEATRLLYLLPILLCLVSLPRRLLSLVFVYLLLYLFKFPKCFDGKVQIDKLK